MKNQIIFILPIAILSIPVVLAKGIIPLRAMADLQRAKGSVNLDVSGNVLLINIATNDFAVLAHELGHLQGLYTNNEQYDINKNNGKFASDGWCLNQDSGASCKSKYGFDYGARTNIWGEADQQSSILIATIDVIELPNKDMIEESRIIVNDKVAPRFYDIMGASKPGSVWVVNDASTNDAVYDYLISRFTNP